MLEITFEVFDTIKHLESFWKESDALASAMIADGRLPRIEYTFYQTFRWNEFVERYYSSQPAVRLGLKHRIHSCQEGRKGYGDSAADGL